MKFALAGNPNSGKTTLFNSLTGSTARVGNWPGVTVDKREGVYKKLPEKVEIVDLPGIYSLSPYTPEEIVSREFIINEKPSCIINIVDATNLERNLYLTTQLLELDVAVVIALNMSDVLEHDGDKIDVSKLQAELKVPVLSISALKNTGLKELMQTAYECAKKGRRGETVIGEQISEIYRDVEKEVSAEYDDNVAFHSIKFIERDEKTVAENTALANKVAEISKRYVSEIFGDDFEGVIADARYRYIAQRCAPALTKTERKDKFSKSDKADKVLTHKIWGIPIFLGIMLMVFHLTFSENLFLIGLFIKDGTFDNAIFGTDAINSPGVILFNLLDWGTSSLAGVISGAMPAGTWYTGLICDGIVSGVFAVLSFIPQIMVLFLFLSILEGSGYMARVAFIMDRAFRNLGLSGKAFMPLISCFGCAVPGIMATRTLEDEAERRRTIMVAPFFSCGAKLPIWAAFSGVFAQAYTNMPGELVVYAMYVLGIAIAIISAIFLKSTIVKGETPPFIMELPEYHLPQLKNLLLQLWQKLKHYIFRAATVIAGATVVIWFLQNFNGQLKMVADSKDSIIGMLAQAFAWLFVPLGFGMGANGYKFVVAAFTGLIAKEMVVATLGTFAGMNGDETLDVDGGELAATPVGLLMLGIGGSALGSVNVAIPAMFSFMAFNLLSVPCMAAVAAANGELVKGKGHTKVAILYWIATSYVVSLITFWYGVLWSVNWIIALIVTVVIISLIITLIILKVKGKIFNRKKAKKETV